MKLEYKVHTVTTDETEITAKVHGKDRQVKTDVLTVELVNEEMGSALTFRFDDVEAASKIFKDGKKVTVSFMGAK